MPDSLTLNFTGITARFTSDMRTYAQRVQTEGAQATHVQMADVRQVVIATTPVDTGFLQAHWGPVEDVSAGSMIAYRIQNPTTYGPIVEYGGYRGVGPRTIAVGGGDLGAGFHAGGGIYSQQAPLGWVRKALARAWPQYHVRLRMVLKQAWPYRTGALAESAPLVGDIGAIFGLDLGGESGGMLSPGTQRAVREVMRGLHAQERRRGR